MFHPGQEIVCIRDDWQWRNGFLPASLPRKGQIYHCGRTDPFHAGYIFLKELPASHANMCGTFWVSYVATFFRPVAKHSADISIFKKLLAPSKTDSRVPEDA